MLIEHRSFLFCAMRRIDHIVYAVPDLLKATKTLEQNLGVDISPGGKHLDKGTHNTVLNLGNEIYLELIAADPNNQNVNAPRWMGVDLVDEPRVTRWSIKTNDLDGDIQIMNKYDSKLAQQFSGSRKKADGTMLNWGMALPLATPLIEIAPFITDWKDTIHPTQSMPLQCKLVSISFSHPEPDRVRSLYMGLGIERHIEQGPNPIITLEIDSPNGLVKLS